METVTTLRVKLLSLPKYNASKVIEMPRKSKALVLDTWAVIAYFEDEPAGQ